MKDFTIKELGELINTINKTPDATIEVATDKGGGVLCAATGLTLKITPYHRPEKPENATTPSDDTDDDV